MPRVNTFRVTATSQAEKNRFLDDMYLIQAEYGLEWPSDAVIFAVNQAARWIKFVRAFSGGIVIGPLENCTEYTPFGDLSKAIEVARANALQDAITYGVWTDEDDLIVILSDRGELFVPGVAPKPYSR